jgi:hypothetical protein
MATQIAERAPAKVPVAAGAKLAAFIPQTLEEAWRLAGALAASGMTPKSYGTDQNKIMVGMMAGAEVGLTPMASLQSIAVIGNNPALWGDGALGLIQASGLLDDMDETDDGNTATCMMKRKGRATPITKTFSMEDAKKAGLAGKAGPWTQYPARMRQMRARAFAMRDGFADVLRGLHIAEEARDYAPMMDGGVMDRAPLTGQALLEQASAEEISPAAGAGSPAEAEPAPQAEEAAASAQPSLAERMQAVAERAKKPEGRADADMGEKTTLADAIAEIDACGTVIDVNGHTAALLPLLGEEDADALRNHAMDRIQTLSPKVG